MHERKETINHKHIDSFSLISSFHRYCTVPQVSLSSASTLQSTGWYLYIIMWTGLLLGTCQISFEDVSQMHTKCRQTEAFHISSVCQSHSWEAEDCHGVNVMSSQSMSFIIWDLELKLADFSQSERVHTHTYTHTYIHRYQVCVFCLISQELYRPQWSWLDSRSCPGCSSPGLSHTVSER